MKSCFSEAGFTLVELLTVLVIVVILAAVAIPKVISAEESANSAACIQNQSAIEVACTLYASRSCLKEIGITGFPDALSRLVPEFLESIPDCPGDGSYTYDRDEGTVSCSETSHNR